MYIITYDILCDFYCVKNQSDALKIKLFQGYVDWTNKKIIDTRQKQKVLALSNPIPENLPRSSTGCF